MLTKRQEENVSNWMSGLMSGKYVQGFAALYSNDTYCCLGVAAEVLRVKKGNMYIAPHIARRKHSPNQGFGFDFPGYEEPVPVHHHNGYLPEEWAPDMFGAWLTPRVQADLAALNDGEKRFPEIAVVISELSGVPLPE